MKTSKSILLPLFLVAVASAGLTWWLVRAPHRADAALTPDSGGRKIKYYQSPMHPWVTSPNPGKCTVCGMNLVAVYEGDKGFGGAEGVVSLGSNSINVLHVRSEAVKRQPLRRSLRVAGTIDDDDSRHRILSAYVDGRIDKLFVNFTGAEVTAGQPLASFYSPMLLNAEREYVLLATPAATHPPGHERLIEAAAQRLRRLGLSAEQIATLPGKPATELNSELLAPVTGTVVKREVYAGQYVKEGERLFEIADFSTMWFKFDAYERDLAWLQPGQKIEVTTPSVPGKVFAATISFIDPNLTDQTRSAKVRVEIPNPLGERDGQRRRELFHRLYAEGVVQVEAPATLTVPRGAVLSPGGRAVVYLDHGDGNYEQREVKLGRAGDEWWEVLGGLAEGDRVVTTGNLLIDGQAQLNQGVATAIAHEHAGHGTNPAPKAAAPSAELSPARHEAIHDVIALVSTLAEALAADNLGQFNGRTELAKAPVDALRQAFAGAAEWAALIQPVLQNESLQPATDLPAARREFHALSTAVVALAQAARRLPGEWNDLKVFQCPMVKNAFPGAPKTGAWVQLSGPIRNPYFGAEMIDCGNEVKP